MPPVNPVIPKAKKKAAPTYSAAPPRQADTGDTTRAKAAPAPQKTRAFQSPLTISQPFSQQQAQAQTSVRQAKRALPAPALAEPPIVGSAGPAKASGAPMTRAQVTTFLQSQHQVTQAAREQIVGSIRQQVGNSHGQERIDRIAGLLDEVATDPRLSRTRAAIRHYSQLEQEMSRPQTTAEIKPGPADTKHHLGIGPLSATINTTAVSQAGAKIGEKIAPTLSIDTPEVQFFKHGWSDIAHLPLMVPQTAYEVAAAAKEAAGGDTHRAKALAKGLLDGVYGHLLKGDIPGALEYFRQHPVFAILELRGGKGIVGRGAGAAMRSGVLGDAARSAASTARKDINLAGETGARVADRQHYSPDVMTKLFQVAVEKARGEGKTVLRDHRLRRRADFESDTAAATSRTVRQDEAHRAEAAKPKGPLADLVGLVVQGLVRAHSIEPDLHKELARLNRAAAHHDSEVAAGREGVFSTGAQKAQNRATAAAIQKVLDSPEAMKRLDEIAQSGGVNVSAINDLEQQAKDVGALTAERADRSALFPAAQSHIPGAQYSDHPFRAARDREVQAARDVRAATQGVEVARRSLAKAVADARVSQTRNKTSPALQAAERDVRQAHAALRTARTAQHENRRQVARQLVRAERSAREAARGFLRRDETYVEFEKELAKTNAIKQKLRQQIREARGTGKDTSKLETALARAATASRSAQGRVAAHAKKLMAEPVTRVATRGKRKGHRVPTARAAVLRAERAKLGPKATMTKPAQVVARSRQAIRDAEAVAAAERRRISGVAPAQADALRRAIDERDAAPLRAQAARSAFDAARSERQAAAIGGKESLNVAGQHITNDEIRQQADLRNPVAYLPHHTQARGARAYYQTAFSGARKNLDSAKKRTGALHEKGAVDVSYEAVKEHRIRMRGVVNRIAEHDRIIHSIAITGPKTAKNPHGMFTWDQAEKVASNASDRGAKLVPYRAVPGSYDRARIDQIANAQGAADAPALGRLIGHEFEERLKAPAAGDKTAQNVVLLPEQMVNQLKAQQNVFSSHGQVGNVAADVFRRTTLPFSAKWLTGNLVEAGLRLGAVGAGPNAYRIGRGLLKELDAVDHDQALRVKAALTGGLLFGNKGLTVRRVHEHFEGTSLEKPAAAIGVAGQLPVVKQLGQLMKHYTDAIFNVNRVFETASQTAALGKYAKREMHEMTGSWAKATRAQQAALHDVAKGLTDTKNMHDAARYIDSVLGQYSRFSPGMRRFVQTYTPFVPWYINAVRWTLWTLPAKHPIKSGLMALAANNLQADYDANHQGLPPGDLKGDIVADDGTVLPYSHYTPFGAFGSLFGGGNEQLTALVDPFFPQYKSAGLAAFGMNFSGHAAKIDPRDRTSASVSGAVRASMFLNSLLEAFVPALATARRVREGGKTPWDNSTFFSPKTKPNTGVGTANRLLNPFRPVSGIQGRPRDGTPAVATAIPTPTAAAPADDFWGSVDQNTAQQDAQDQEDFWNNNGG